MARMFPHSVKYFNKDHISEIEVYSFLEYILPHNYYVFGNIRVSNHKSDFIIIEPNLGLLVLEVKSWPLNYIIDTDVNNYYLIDGKIKLNPLEQAEKYATYISNILQKEKTLCQVDEKYKGNLKFCYSYGVVFTNITKSEFLNSKFRESINQQSILFIDEIEDIKHSKDINKLEEKFKNMFIPEKSFKFDPLSEEDMELIRQVLYKKSNISYQEPDMDNTQEMVPINPIPTSIEKSIEDIKNDINNISELITQPQKRERVRPKTKFKSTERLKRKSFIARFITFYFKFILISFSIFICLGIYFAYKDNIPNFLGKLNLKGTTVFSRGNESETIDSKPIMTFKVESNPKGYSTHIVIKDGKKYLTSKSFAQGSSIEFYDNKKIIIYDAKSDKKEFDVESDVIDLEVGNAYTKIYLEGEEYKFTKYFKYDFVNREIIKTK